MLFMNVILTILNLVHGFETIEMNPENQQLKKTITIVDLNDSSNYCFTYGLWTKYNPLANIKQVGLYGLFNDYCFNLHNAVAIDSQSLNFIYYDCLDKQQKQIKKTIQFINDIDEQYKFEIIINPFEYENIWYFMQIIQWPALERFELIISQQQALKLHKIIKMKSPYSDKNLILTFGSNFIVQYIQIYQIIGNSKILSIQNGDTFTYFPGYIRLQDYIEQSLSPQFDFIGHSQTIYESFKTCICNLNENQLINDQNFSYLQQNQYISQNQNCDSFILIGWIKIRKIVKVSEVLNYQFIKISANSDNPIIEDQNLSPFQLFYYISEKGNHIEITTYSYQFPDVSINFQDNPFIIQDKLPITNNITLWHYLKVELKFNQIIMDLKFYEIQNSNHFIRQYDVIQFNNYQFKIKFGNCLQFSQNYLNIDIRNFQFYNCQQQLNEYNCHYSCLTCDGPTSDDCLSCSESRIYLKQFKVCICPYNTIDENKNCQNYLDSNLQLIKKDRINKQCKQGYFQIDNECQKCPSIIKENMITCFECYNNPLNWQQEFNCQTSLYLSTKGSIDNSLIPEGQDKYYFDGQQLNYLYDYYILQYVSNPEIIENIYHQYQLGFIYFKYFCQYQDQQIFDSAMCYRCIFQNCISCQISLTGLFCQQCQSGYILIDGVCNSQKWIRNDPICIPPDYISYSRQCKKCLIKNCIYCFEYLSYNQNICSLWPQYIISEHDFNYVRIGCALCEDNYIFDFTINLCIYQKPQLQNCQRSFIDKNSKEKCTLSIKDDFSIAPEIINCENHIQNCLQCTLNISSVIKCVICINGFIVENNQCVPNEEYQVPDYHITIWTNKIQSFILQFIPILNSYQYQQYLQQNQNQFEYCGPDCLICEYNTCQQCPLNYFKKQIKAEQGKYCSDCPQLCQACMSRSDIEIKTYQSHFRVTQENVIFTKKCIKPYLDPAIQYDPYNQISRYCFENDCQNSFVFRFSYYSCDFSRFNRLYETKINKKYLNQIGIDTLDFEFQLETYEQICYLFFPMRFSTQLKENVFTLKYTNFKIHSLTKLFIYPIYSAEFINFDEVVLSNLDFIIYSNYQFIFENESKKVKLSLLNITIDSSSFNNVNSLFETQIFDSININNLTISNSIFNRSTLFKLNKQDFYGSIIIIGLFLYNCTFIDSQLFYISNLQSNISIQNFNMENSNAENSQIFNFESQVVRYILFSMNQMQVNNNQFMNSIIINITNLIELKIIDLQFTQNILFNSTILSLNFRLKLNQIYIEQNIFKSSQSIIIVQKLFQQTIPCLIEKLQIIKNQFEKSSLLLIFSTYSTNNLALIIQNTQIQQNYKSTTNDIDRLFDINCYSILLNTILITQNKNLLILFLSDIQQLQIDDIIYSGQLDQFKIPLVINDLSFIQQNKLIIIQGISSIQINNLIIKNQISIDESLFEIIQSSKDKNNQICQISLNNILFQQNILLQLNKINRLSLFRLESDLTLNNITLQNITYRFNMFHSYINYVIRTQASLLYIQSSLSSIYIQQFLGDQNTLTNSSNTFVVISSETLKLLNYTIKYQNWLNKDLWIKYYDLKLDDNNNQEDFNKIIFSTLKLNNQGGAGKLHTSIFFCIDCFFDHILAQEGFLFDITTSGQGVINLVNLTVNYAENNLESTEKYYGCLKIDSSNGQLNLNLKNAIFQYVQNRMATSILTVFPSKIQNLITIENVKIIDCLSLFNQIMNIQFSQLITNKNLVFIKNLTIIQNLQIWNTYFTQIKILSNEELNEIVQNNNALIFMENCNIQLKGLIIEGVFISPIMKFINIPRLQIELLRIQNIIIFYQFTLIHVMQIANIKSIIKFQEIDIQNVSIYEVLEESNIHTNNDKNNTILIHPLRKPSLQNFLNENAKLFQLNSLQFGSIFNFKSLSTQSFFYFDRIKLMKNNCQHCEKGLMYFELEEFQEIRISSLNCIQNQIKQFGCLYFTKNKYDQTKIIVKNSNFLFNQGTQGVAITNINIYFKLISSKIIQNTASELGGGIYFEIDSNTFIVNQSIIISNIAKIGGGIYLKGLSNLNKNNFINSILLFNQALEQGNNVIEIPSHLALFINSKEIPSTSKIINDIQTNQMKLNTYQILEQDQIRQYEELIIPSNQIIKDFQIFDIRQSKYKLFIENMELYYKNSRNELLKTFFNLTCLINQSIIIKSDSYIENQKKNKIVKFNNEKQHFDLSSLQFTLDPYQNYEHLLISIYCKFHDKEKGLMYQIKAKSLKCQLGEFYVNEGCQICQSNQGFYSVTYNTTKCSIFDKTKFSNITSNMIDLLPGYWRPHNLSDFTEECFKNQAYCQGGWLVGYNLCIPGHIGALCEECDIYDIRGFGNFYKNQWNQQCQICQDKWDGIISLILILIWTFLSIILSLRSINRSNKLFTQLKLIRRYHKILFKLNQDHESILIKLMINYLWTFQVIFTFNIKFSLSFYFVEQISNSSYSIASNQDCHLSKISTNPLIYIKLLMMITFIISQFNIIFLASFCYFKKMKHKYDLSILTNTLLYLYIVNYAGLMKMLSSVLSIRVISNINYIQGDVTLQFGDQNHKYWIFYCVLPGLIFFGFLIPVFILVFLLINRNNLDKIKLRKHICYLLNEYESQSYFWEQIKQLKKTIIIFILTHFETQILFKALLLGLCLLIYQILAINQKPFVIKTFNSLDLEAAQICSISIYLTAIKYICEQQNIHYATIILEISIIGLFIRLFYLFMQNIFRIYYKKYKIPILANLCEIFKLIGKNFILTIYLNKILSFHKEKEQRLQNNYLKLRNYLLYFTKIQLRNSKLLTYQNISERIQTVKSSRSDFEKINFLGIGELNDHII